MRRPLTFLVLLIVFISLAAYSQLRSQEPEIASPGGWVPFRADIEKTGTESALKNVGTYYRSSDGSERTELGAEDDSSRLITIMNVAQNMYYQRARNGVWCSHPMGISPAKGWRPFRMREGNPNIRPTVTVVETFDVRELISRDSVQLVAPALNFFAHRRDEKTTGLRERYFNVGVGEQDSALFQPPVGVLVVKHTQKMGNINDGSPAPNLRDVRAAHK